MPLLNIGKKKEQAPAVAAEAVPEELPDLPPDAAAAPDQSQEALADAVPADLPPITPDLAPDELPPVDQTGFTESGAGLAPATSGLGDRKLYFSNMLQRLHEEGIKSTKLTSSSVNLLSDMKKHWRDTKKEEELQSMERQVADKLSPLQRLEQDWISLKDDIEAKKQLMREKEEQIRKLSEELRSLAIQTEKMGGGKK